MSCRLHHQSLYRGATYGSSDDGHQIDDISARPACVETKARVGDWEVDTIIGKGHRGALVDRMSKLVLIQRVIRETAVTVA